MNDDELRKIMVAAILEVAPDVEEDDIPEGDCDLRDELELDSMDILNYTIALHQALKIEIPEADAKQLLTLDGGLAYLRSKLS
jgi:acyl carrier protein